MFVALMLGLLFISSVVARRMVQGSGEFAATDVLLSETFGLAMVLFATWVMGRIERRSVADYGLPWQQLGRRQFWAGALWGFVMLSVIVALMASFRVYSPGGLALPPARIPGYAFLWFLAFCLVGLFEELLFRGYVQFTLTSGLGFWPAAAITCLLFAAAHRGNPGETPVGLANIVLIAIFLCLALRRTGNLWFAIGWHMAYDWGESFFYSVPNSGLHANGHLLNASLTGSKWLSGGTVGPEASVFNLLVSVVGIYALTKLYPEAKYPAPAETTPPVAEIPPIEQQAL